ncbi:tRNA dihydrouridine synthase DusB [Ahrensia sp. R2A130]|uniref:tRNA dihydrouridine synthase DusB n=1 Tax=Ahrensia sp. R2A130 TaxID=744979 RepID=UPI0001E0B45A|nr:tRNA dihydrouridine synthase DusB [Ahrensia sp. R2A130]EFL90135.1 tRNA-dihydrouridine synthase B [Ahrensia sp. R2A130]
MLEESPKQEQPFTIGNRAVRNAAFLAPMSGVTDVPFRRLAWRYGAGMVVSEMVASEALTTGMDEMVLKAAGAGLPDHMVQLAGREPQWMDRATRMAEDAGATIIDINMGCPSKRVTNGYSGSALMRDLDNAEGLINAVVAATDLPVTLKMRLGWDEQSINAPELARRAENAGVQMLTVHGRTRNQFYKGTADWDAIRAVREASRLPLVVNGDICDEATACAALIASGADGVMIGRASYGAPWLPGQIGAALAGTPVPETPSGEHLAALVCEHVDAMLSHYGLELGLRNARKHIDWYAAHLPKDVRKSPLRRAIMTGTDATEVLSMVEKLFSQSQVAPIRTAA